MSDQDITDDEFIKKLEDMVRYRDSLPYPVTIIMTRYAGTYEGGPYAAFNVNPQDVPLEATGSDVPCMWWWDYNSHRVGVGGSPNDALADLTSKIKQGVHCTVLPDNPIEHSDWWAFFEEDEETGRHRLKDFRELGVSEYLMFASIRNRRSSPDGEQDIYQEDIPEEIYDKLYRRFLAQGLFEIEEWHPIAAGADHARLRDMGFELDEENGIWRKT